MGSKWVELYADGSYLPVLGKGGYAYLIRRDGEEDVLNVGASIKTTNNRMEMLGIIRGLQFLQGSHYVTIYTDSQYVHHGITEWIDRWRHNGFITSGGNPVKNKDLWLLLEECCQSHRVIWNWILAHNGHPYHDRVDKAARDAAYNLVTLDTLGRVRPEHGS